MGYVDTHLMRGERVVYRAKLNGAVFIAPILLACLGLVTVILLIGVFLIPAAVVWIVRLASVEFAVTERRVIGKVGVISTRSVDLLLTKVESVSINRGVLGAIFGYGTVTVCGTGGRRVALPGIDAPESVRRAFLTEVEAAEAIATAPPPPLVSAVFDVQIVDRQSGEESWVPIRAETADEAVGLAARTGAVVGKCKLKAIG
jgi:hypothetical protein